MSISISPAKQNLPPGVVELKLSSGLWYRGYREVGGDEVETRTYRSPEAASSALDRQARAMEEQLDRELNRVQLRASPDPEFPPFCRVVAGGAIQARPYVVVQPGWWTNINLGLFSPARFEGCRESAIAFAKHVSFTFVKLFSGLVRRDAWDVIREMKGMRHRGMVLVRSHIMPPNVKRVEGGYIGRRKRGGEVVWESSSHRSVEGAWAAVREYRRELHEVGVVV